MNIIMIVIGKKVYSYRYHAKEFKSIKPLYSKVKGAIFVPVKSAILRTEVDLKNKLRNAGYE